MDIIQHFFQSINWVDYLFLFFLIYFAATNSGVVTSILDIIGLFFAFLLSYVLYKPIGEFLVSHSAIQKGLGNVLGLLISWIIAEIIFYIIVRLIVKKIPRHIFEHRWNYLLGLIPGALYGLLFFTFLVSLLIALPVKGNLKQTILSSKTGPHFVRYSTIFEGTYKSIFNDAIAESLNFLTVKENSDSVVDLGFTVSKENLSVDKQSEEQMLRLVNEERTKRGLNALEIDDDLREAARTYGEHMFVNGFFAHESPIDNTTPAERLDNKGIEYLIMGENLAFAPSVDIAHTGLMNSPGHKANILSPEYNKIGLGVIDGGIYGKMFVQEFSN